MTVSGVQVLLRPTPQAMADTAAEECEAVLREALTARGRASIVVTGGSTPGPVYDRLSRAVLDWSRISITLSDERCVPADHDDSNERMIRARLLQGPAAAARFVPLARGGEPEADAAAASADLARLPRPFDLVVLGMGDDGHIASLFPGSPVLARALDDTDQDLVIAVPAGDGRAPSQPRLSLTLQALKSAGRVILMFTGRRKFDVLEAALQTPDPHLYPVCAILGARGGVRVICAS